VKRTSSDYRKRRRANGWHVSLTPSLKLGPGKLFVGDVYSGRFTDATD
jgi:hypothetical protein